MADTHTKTACAHVHCERPATDSAFGMEWCRGHLFTAYQWRQPAFMSQWENRP